MYSITNCIPVVYRHFNLLENSIDSILSQTFLPNEIIVIISEFEETKISKDKVDFLTKKIF